MPPIEKLNLLAWPRARATRVIAITGHVVWCRSLWQSDNGHCARRTCRTTLTTAYNFDRHRPAQVNGIVRTYSDAQPRTAVALFGSSGLLEVAIVQGNAASDLHLAHAIASSLAGEAHVMDPHENENLRRWDREHRLARVHADGRVRAADHRARRRLHALRHRRQRLPRRRQQHVVQHPWSSPSRDSTRPFANSSTASPMSRRWACRTPRRSGWPSGSSSLRRPA